MTADAQAPLALQTEHLDAQAARWMGERCRLVRADPGEAAFEEALPQAAAMVIRTYTQVTAGLLDRARALKVIGRAGVGIDNIDLAACKARNIEVVYTPDANTQAVVEYVLALLLDAVRPRVVLDRALPQDEWNHLRNITVGQRQMNELTLGILGLGRVGKGVAKAAAGLGCRVLYHDLLEIAPAERHGAVAVSLEDLFSNADVVTLHVDGRSGNRNLVGADLLNRMKANAMLINTSRGFVVDSRALAEACRAQPQRLALLDVHEPEPLAADSPLLGLKNVQLYPHLASRTVTAMANMSWVVRDVWEVLQGRRPRWPAQ